MIEQGTKVRATFMNRDFRSSRSVDVIYEGHIVLGGDTFIFVTESSRRGTYGINARYVLYWTPYEHASALPLLDESDTGERYEGFTVRYLREVYRSISNPNDRKGPIDVTISPDLVPAAKAAVERFARAPCYSDKAYPDGGGLISCRLSSPGFRDRKNKDWEPQAVYRPYPVPDSRLVYSYDVSEKKRIRNRKETRAWKKAVFARDGHKCQDCGTTENLRAHHIESFDAHPALRFVVSNGLTVCERCHYAIHRASGPDDLTHNRFARRAQAGAETPQRGRKSPRRRRGSRVKSDTKDQKYPVMASAVQERVVKERIRQDRKRGRRRR